MAPAPSEQNDWQKIKGCLAGDLDSLGKLRDEFDAVLRVALIGKGASMAEAEDLLADFWGDCVPSDPDSPSILEKYNGKASLKAWLATVLTNKFYDFKRRQKIFTPASDGETNRPSDNGHIEASRPDDPALLELLHDCLRRAFDRCPADALVMLKLVHIHQITQREVGRMWGWHESKVSRKLGNATKDIEKDTLRFLKEKEPILHLQWHDFTEMCETFRLEFGQGQTGR